MNKVWISHESILNFSSTPYKEHFLVQQLHFRIFPNHIDQGKISHSTDDTFWLLTVYTAFIYVVKTIILYAVFNV